MVEENYEEQNTYYCIFLQFVYKLNEETAHLVLEHLIRRIEFFEFENKAKKEKKRK